MEPKLKTPEKHFRKCLKNDGDVPKGHGYHPEGALTRQIWDNLTSKIYDIGNSLKPTE